MFWYPWSYAYRLFLKYISWSFLSWLYSHALIKPHLQQNVFKTYILIDPPCKFPPNWSSTHYHIHSVVHLLNFTIHLLIYNYYSSKSRVFYFLQGHQTFKLNLLYIFFFARRFLRLYHATSDISMRQSFGDQLLVNV